MLYCGSPSRHVVLVVAVNAAFRRGVAQPGRAPGSGPGGRRFKSSLPDQFLQAVRAISAPAVLGAMGATGNFGATVGMWKPSPACSAVNVRNSTSSFTFE